MNSLYDEVLTINSNEFISRVYSLTRIYIITCESKAIIDQVKNFVLKMLTLFNYCVYIVRT